MLSPLYEELRKTGISELGAWLDQVQPISTPSGVVVKLRFWLIDGDFVDAYAAESGRFAFHFEGRTTGRGIYRHDNAPHGSALDMSHISQTLPLWRRQQHCSKRSPR